MATEMPTAPSPPPAPDTAPAPRLADGIELIGRFEDSGFKEPPFIARRADGQVVQLAPLLYAVADRVDGSRGHGEIADEVSEVVKRKLEADDVRFLIDEKLVPLGVVAPPNGEVQELRKADPLDALKFRTAVIPDRLVRAITTVFRPLFFPPVVVAIVGGMLALDGWLLFSHGVSQSLRSVIYQPAVLLLVFAGIVVATALHEVGHATACRYGGAKPGVMGVGIYIVWPAFYTDVTDAYRLGKWGRLRTDLGGVYFNAVFALTVAALYAVTGFEPLLLLVLLQNFAILQQLLPLLRLDGYYIISDLTGVPDMLGRIRPILTSVLPWRRTDERVAELKPWVRVAVTGYVAAIVPVLAFAFVMMLLQAPRVFATAYDSLGVRWDAASAAFGSGQAVDGIANGLQMAGLVLPVLGVALTTGRVGHRAGGAAWAWSAGEPLRRALVVLPAVAALGLAAFVWWPNGDYKPIQPNERGTVQGGLRSLADVGTGRPALTPQRERQLHGAPSRRDATPTRPQQLRGPAGTGQERPATTTPAAPAPQDQSTLPDPSSGPAPAAPTPPPATETTPAAPAPSDPSASPAGSAPGPTATTP